MLNYILLVLAVSIFISIGLIIGYYFFSRSIRKLEQKKNMGVLLMGLSKLLIVLTGLYCLILFSVTLNYTINFIRIHLTSEKQTIDYIVISIVTIIAAIVAPYLIYDLRQNKPNLNNKS